MPWSGQSPFQDNPAPPQSGLPPPSSPTPGDTIHRSLLCGRCGYDLRGLASDALCPECGAPIARSLHPHALHFAAPEHLQRLYRGVTLLEIAAVFRIAASGVVWLSGFWVGGQGKAYLGIFCSLVASVAYSLGWWWLTTPDPRRTDREAKFSLRARARAFALALATVATMLTFLDAVRSLGLAPIGFVRPLLILSWFLLIVVQFFAAVDYFADLARRAEDPAWVKWVGTCRWLIPVGLLLVVPAIIVYILLLDSVRRGIARVAAFQRKSEATPDLARS